MRIISAKDQPIRYLYELLIIMFIGTLIFWLFASNEYKSLAENLLTASIEISITVILIERLFDFERKRRLAIVNAEEANATGVYIAALLVKTISIFDYKAKPSELDIVSSTNAELRKYIDGFRDSTEYNQFLASLRVANKSISPSIESAKEAIETLYSGIGKSVKNAKPYPDPVLAKMQTDTYPSVLASFELIDFMYEMVHENLPKIESEHPNDKKGSKIARDILSDFMQEIASESGGSEDRANFNRSFTRYIDAVLTIHERAENNKLHFDL